MNQSETSKNIDFILQLLWTLGFVIALFLIFTIFENGIDKATSLIGAFAILISAGIASASVMKNITVTRENEERKHKKEESKFYLDKSIQYLSHVCELLKKRPRDFLPWIEATNTLLNMKLISKHITEESHKKILDMEYLQYSTKLFESIMKDEKGDYSPITPVFFCLDINIETTLEMAFENSQVKLNPIFIVPIFDFAEQKNNNFLKNNLDYGNWEKLNLKREKGSLLSLCAVEYINLYKEKISANEEQQ